MRAVRIYVSNLDQDCSRYMVGTRGKGEVSTGTNPLGFRVEKSDGNWARA